MYESKQYRIVVQQNEYKIEIQSTTRNISGLIYGIIILNYGKQNDRQWFLFQAVIG